jgi:transcriptional regulator with XRE-family HTH domain
MNSSRKELGLLIKSQRRSLRPRPDQAYVAEQLGMSTVWLQKVEQGKNIPSLTKLEELLHTIKFSDDQIETIISKYSSIILVQRTMYLPLNLDRRLVQIAEANNVSPQDLMKKFIEEGVKKSD